MFNNIAKDSNGKPVRCGDKCLSKKGKEIYFAYKKDGHCYFCNTKEKALLYKGNSLYFLCGTCATNYAKFTNTVIYTVEEIKEDEYPKDTLIKGKTSCNRTACQVKLDPDNMYFNEVMNANYCPSCAKLINHGTIEPLCVKVIL